MGNKVAERIKYALLAFVNALGTVWNFLFLKTPDPDESDFDKRNEIRQDIEQFFGKLIIAFMG